MKFVIVNEVDGMEQFTVVDADTPIEAMHQDSFNIFMDAETFDNHEVATVGIYEVGAVNHLVAIADNHEVHSFYRKKLESIGIDPNNLKNK